MAYINKVNQVTKKNQRCHRNRKSIFILGMQLVYKPS